MVGITKCAYCEPDIALFPFCLARASSVGSGHQNPSPQFVLRFAPPEKRNSRWRFHCSNRTTSLRLAPRLSGNHACLPYRKFTFCTLRTSVLHPYIQHYRLQLLLNLTQVSCPTRHSELSLPSYQSVPITPCNVENCFKKKPRSIQHCTYSREHRREHRSEETGGDWFMVNTYVTQLQASGQMASTPPPIQSLIGIYIAI